MVPHGLETAKGPRSEPLGSAGYGPGGAAVGPEARRVAAETDRRAQRGNGARVSPRPRLPVEASPKGLAAIRSAPGGLHQATS